MKSGPILALDLSITRTGWALGAPGVVPENGSLRFAKAGHSIAAHLAGCRDWLTGFCAERLIDLVVFESPLAPSFVEGRTTTLTVRALMGLCAVVETTLYGTRIEVREASVTDIRQFFLGSAKYRSADAKVATFKRCVELNWQPRDEDAADALALWAYQVSIIDPAVGVRLLPLFGRRA